MMFPLSGSAHRPGTRLPLGVTVSPVGTTPPVYSTVAVPFQYQPCLAELADDDPKTGSLYFPSSPNCTVSKFRPEASASKIVWLVPSLTEAIVGGFVVPKAPSTRVNWLRTPVVGSMSVPTVGK